MSFVNVSDLETKENCKKDSIKESHKVRELFI
jgi:hypothetical protein